MNINPVSLWTNAHVATSQAAINSRIVREVLRWVIMGSMIMACLTVFQIFSFVRAGQVTAVVGTLLGGVLSFFSGVLYLAIQSLITALRTTDNKENGAGVPLTPVVMTDDKNA